MIPGSDPGLTPAGESTPALPRLVVGLGNPGPEYAGTRHNVGFATLDLLATRRGGAPSVLKVGGRRLARILTPPDRRPSEPTSEPPPEPRWGLLWPLTYMNLSGPAVRAALARLGSAPASLFVLCDDFHLELGALRARPGGSSGGHKGLGSIESALGTRDFARLRIGVGDPGGDAVEFVLSRFSRAEREVVDETVGAAAQAAEDWILGASIDEIAARYNRRKP